MLHLLHPSLSLAPANPSLSVPDAARYSSRSARQVERLKRDPEDPVLQGTCSTVPRGCNCTPYSRSQLIHRPLFMNVVEGEFSEVRMHDPA